MSKAENKELEVLAREFQEATGIRADFSKCESPSRSMMALRRMMDAYYDRMDKSAELLDLLKRFSGNGEDFKREYINGLNINIDEPYMLFLVKVIKGSLKGMLSQFRSIICEGAGDFVLDGDGEIIVIKRAKKPDLKEGSLKTAEMIYDSLSAEFMVECIVAYAPCADSFASLPTSLSRARRTMDAGEIFSEKGPIFSFESMEIELLVMDLPKETCLSFLKSYASLDKIKKMGGDFLRTVFAFYDHGLAISETAKDLFIHRNTLVYRLEKLHSLTGLDIRKFEDAMKFRLIFMIYRRLKGSFSQIFS